MSRLTRAPISAIRLHADVLVRLGLGVAAAALTVYGISSYLGFADADRDLLRLASFALVPASIVITYLWSGGHRRRPLFVLVGLLDLEAVLVGSIAVEGMALAVAIPLIGIAYVTSLLPPQRAPVPFIAAWLASTAGVVVGIVTWVEPGMTLTPPWTLVPIFAVVDAAGLLVMWQTANRRAEAVMAIAEAEARFREMLDGVDLVAADIDRDGRLRFVNEFGSRLLGVAPADAIGLDYYETFVPPERRADARTRLAAMREGADVMPRQRESEVMTLTGDRRLIRWGHVKRFDEHGRFESLASIGEDVTAQRAAEDSARRASELIEALVESSPLPTVILGLDRRVQRWNAAATQLFGWSAEEVLGRTLPNVAPDDVPVGAGNTLAQAIAGTPIRGTPATLRARDGTKVRVLLYVNALRDGDGNPVAFAAQAVDVTGQEAMEERLREAQKMEAVGRLAGGIAHDFNNNLTAIGGFATLIGMSTDDPDIREQAESISASVRRASNLTRELLAYSRRSMLQPETIDVNVLVGSVRPILRRLLAEDIQLVIESTASDALVRADPGQLEQAILNLTVNARDAMPQGGLLRISIGCRSDGAGGQDVVISVADTGCGIPHELQSKVFDPFFTTKPIGAGTGLGLAMVQGFVAQSGGHVALHSRPGEGTTIEIVLPIATGPTTDVPAPLEPATPGAGETIVYVEDEPAVAAVGFHLLSRRGYRVLLADSGATAIALLEAHAGPVALLLIDVILPDIHGTEVALAARRSHPEAAVLFCSGYPADAFERRGDLAAGVDLIEKPYSPEQLALRVRAAIERQRSERLVASLEG